MHSSIHEPTQNIAEHWYQAKIASIEHQPMVYKDGVNEFERAEEREVLLCRLVLVAQILGCLLNVVLATVVALAMDLLVLGRQRADPANLGGDHDTLAA